MKIECSRKDLHEALNLAATASSVRTAMPILSTLHIVAEASQIILTGCDGEMWAERKILANVKEPGSVCVSAALVRELISKLPDGNISIESDGGMVYVRFGQSDWRMMGLPSEDFPSFPEINEKNSLSLTMGEFREVVDGVAFAVADDSTRPVLTGVQMKYDGENLILVATDTHRLAVRKLTKSGIGSNMEAIVPEKALKAIRNLPLTDEEEIKVIFDESQIAVDSGPARVACQLLVGQYPNWEKVVPAEATRTWMVERVELIDNVNRAMILAKDSANRIKFSGKGDQVVISARSEDKGEAKEEVAAVSKNGDIDIAFNGRYVLDALTALRCDGVRAEMTEPSRPAVFRPVEDQERHFCVIMPMALG